MTEAKHTPGPWHLEEMGYNSSSYYIRGSSESGDRLTIGKGAVAHIPRSTVNPMEANARLIAAAPELLEALKAMLEAEYAHEWEDYSSEELTVLEKAHAAIAKAEGGAA